MSARKPSDVLIKPLEIAAEDKRSDSFLLNVAAPMQRGMMEDRTKKELGRKIYLGHDLQIAFFLLVIHRL